MYACWISEKVNNEQVGYYFKPHHPVSTCRRRRRDDDDDVKYVYKAALLVSHPATSTNRTCWVVRKRNNRNSALFMILNVRWQDLAHDLQNRPPRTLDLDDGCG
jgi:hypothetical protein